MSRTVHKIEVVAMSFKDSIEFENLIEELVVSAISIATTEGGGVPITLLVSSEIIVPKEKSIILWEVNSTRAHFKGRSQVPGGVTGEDWRALVFSRLKTLLRLSGKFEVISTDGFSKGERDVWYQVVEIVTK